MGQVESISGPCKTPTRQQSIKPQSLRRGFGFPVEKKEKTGKKVLCFVEPWIRLPCLAVLGSDDAAVARRLKMYSV